MLTKAILIAFSVGALAAMIHRRYWRKRHTEGLFNAPRPGVYHVSATYRGFKASRPNIQISWNGPEGRKP